MTIAYQDIPAASGNFLGRILRPVAAFLSMLGRNMDAAELHERMNMLTDVELAARGMTRADIALVARDVLLRKH